MGVFAVLVLALGWLVVALFKLLPTANGWQTVSLVLLMGTPAAAALIADVLFERRPGRVGRLGLGVALDYRFAGICLLAVAVPYLFAVLAPAVSAGLGLTSLDLRDLSGFRALVDAQLRVGGGDPTMFWEALSPHGLLAIQLVQIPLGTMINMVPCLGEELGWRGYLLPRLRALPLGPASWGPWPALLLSGGLWGIWHAPAILLLGHNYPTAPVLGTGVFVVFCVLWGVLHGAVRLMSGSVWPPTLMHAALNASAGFTVLVLARGAPADSLWVGAVSIPAMGIALVLIGLFWALPGWRTA